MDERDRVAAFVAEHGLETDLAYRVLDLESEVGEIAKEVATSTEYGSAPDAAAIASDELGDTLFALPDDPAEPDVCGRCGARPLRELSDVRGPDAYFAP